MDLFNLLTQVAPQWAGYLIAILALWKISTNALHGVAKTNTEIAQTQSQLVIALQEIQREIHDHSESDARVFDKIDNSLGKHVELLTRLEERTR